MLRRFRELATETEESSAVVVATVVNDLLCKAPNRLTQMRRPVATIIVFFAGAGTAPSLSCEHWRSRTCYAVGCGLQAR